MKNSKISLVSSAYNEFDCIFRMTDYLRELSVRIDPNWEIVLVDNASSDEKFSNSLKLAFENIPNLIVKRNPSGKGWGDGIKFGLKCASNERVVIFPSDMQYSLEDIIKVATLTSQSKSNQIILTERIRRDELKLRLRGMLWKKLLKILFIPGNDPMSQLRGFTQPKEYLLSLKSHNHMWDMESLLFARKLRWEIIETKVEFHNRPCGSTTTKNSIYLGISSIIELFRIWLRFLKFSKTKGFE
jgi:glycosyltransferase involved in cell wall biosynthesis